MGRERPIGGLMRLNVARWEGDGSRGTAVLLHGVTSNAASWARVGPLLAAMGFEVYGPDLRGHGDSPRADGHYSIDEMLQDLPDSLPADPDLLVGHSFGGTLAILGIADGLLTPRSLLLEDPVLHFADRERPAAYLAQDEATLPRTIDGTLALNPRWDPLDAAGKVASLAAIDWGHMRQVFAGNAPWDLRDALVSLAGRLPILVLLAQDSVYVPAADSARLADALGPEWVVGVEGSGHSIHRDDLPRFMAEMRRLLGIAGPTA